MPGEIVKARRNLKQLRDDIVEAAKETQRNQDINEGLKTDNHVLFRKKTCAEEDLEKLYDEIEKRHKELGILDKAVEGKRYVVIMLDDSIEASAVSLEDIEVQTRNLIDQLSVLEYENQSVDKDLQGKQLLRERFEKDIRELIGKKVSLENAVARLLKDLDRAVAKKDGVLGAIEEALANFRIFERRIAQFTEDTGYMVGYPRPDVLLDNE